MTKRNIGIVGDGSTDRAIFRKIVEVILLDDVNYVDLSRQNLHDYVETYWRNANKKQQYYLPSEHCLQLQKEVTSVLIGAFNDFELAVGIGEISNQDILLLTTDAERSFSNPEDYFKDWGCSISKILMGAVEKFYSIKARDGHPYQYLPSIIPIVIFPSTEIFVAAAKNIINAKNYSQKPDQLKQLLYGTTNLATLREEQLQEKALDFITPESVDKIFQCVPESRMFIQMLSLGKSIAACNNQ